MKKLSPARLVAVASFAAFLSAAPFQEALAQDAPWLGAAATFTGGRVIGRDLAKGAATLTGATGSACSPATPPAACMESVTGVGWIRLADGSKGTFEVAGGIRHGKPSGQLTYVDRDSKGSKVENLRVKGTGVTAYTVVDAVTRHIEGTAEVNGRTGYTYQVDVVDGGGSGREDAFSLRLSNNYSASAYLGGGNIRLRTKCGPQVCLAFDKDDGEGEGHPGSW